MRTFDFQYSDNVFLLNNDRSGHFEYQSLSSKFVNLYPYSQYIVCTVYKEKRYYFSLSFSLTFSFFYFVNIFNFAKYMIFLTLYKSIIRQLIRMSLLCIIFKECVRNVQA